MKYWSIILCFFSLVSHAQMVQEVDLDIEWINRSNDQLWFDGAQVSDEYPGAAVWTFSFPLPSRGVLEVDVEILNEELALVSSISGLEDNFIVSSSIVEERGDFNGLVRIIPMRMSNQQMFLLTSAKITTTFTESAAIPTGPDFKDESSLASGKILKMSIQESGMYKLTGSDLATALEVAVGDINIQKIQLLGNHGGIVPLANADERNDDLEPIPYQWYGVDNGVVSNQDYMIFYAEGIETWTTVGDEWNREVNPYDDFNYVFIRYGEDDGITIREEDRSQANGVIKSTHTNRQYYGKADINLLGQSFEHQGSGRLWVSDEISNTRTIDLTNQFDFSNRIQGSPIHFQSHVYGRSFSSSNFEWSIGGQTFDKRVTHVIDDIEAELAKRANFDLDLSPSGREISVILNYPETSIESKGWLDYVELMTQDKADFSSKISMILTDTFQSNNGGFQISGFQSNTEIWDVTDLNDPIKILPQISGSTASFSVEQPQHRIFAVFNPDAINTKPLSIVSIENQNLHAIQETDMITVYHPLFKEEAERHAEHRKQWDGIDVITVDVNQIYNEFASGRKEPTAIRDFARMLYNRTDRFKYLLLFGDGSYDYRYTNTSLEDQNFVPVFETEESLAPIFAFPTDDFFALLSDTEGKNLIGSLDIGTGRFLCKSPEEAKLLVDKVIHYDSNKKTLGDWRNRLVFLADDEDDNTHLRDVESLANQTMNSNPEFNQDKIYLDAYTQVSTPGGTRYPDVTEAINANAFKGALTMVYLGHGGPTGLSQERVLQSNDILEWDNYDHMPIIITATCSFTAFDEPSITSAGEHSVLSTKGGAIAILSTVRAVYAGDNFQLTKAVHNYIYEKDANGPMRLGEIMRLAKNESQSGGTDVNNRKFSLFGDPSLQIALPEYNVSTSKINDIPVDQFNDTLGALDFVVIEGEVLDQDEMVMTDFNGEIAVTLYDKSITLRTKGQDRRSYERDFDLQKNILFKGSASVVNGEWTIQFAIPKDLNFNFGLGKISYYAHDNEKRDATGSFHNIIIGGNGDTSVSDDEGPEVEVFMNDEHFQFGGITSPDPVLFVKLSDDNGINVVGNSIGHDLTGVLDYETQNSFILNDFYQAEKDDYKKGTVRFPLRNLEEGRHHIQVTAWDIANNFSEGFTEFVVVKNVRTSIQKVLSYPNPFSDYTIMGFEHNFPPGQANIEVVIVNAAGQEVNKIKRDFDISGFRVTDVTWDGTDYSGNKVTNGVYLYKIIMRRSVLGSEITKESSFERLVVLK